MNTRTTEKQLQSMLDVLNYAAETPKTTFNKDNPGQKWNIGHFQLDYANGRVGLVQITGPTGGCRIVIHGTTKGELWRCMHHMIDGIGIGSQKEIDKQWKRAMERGPIEAIEKENADYNRKDLVRKLTDRLVEIRACLAEAHQDELNRDHHGDKPETCSYCRAIKAAQPVVALAQEFLGE